MAKRDKEKAAVEADTKEKGRHRTASLQSDDRGSGAGFGLRQHAMCQRLRALYDGLDRLVLASQPQLKLRILTNG